MKSQTKVPLARLYQKTSANGATYFVGKMGQARVLLFRDRHEQTESGDEVWNLLVEPFDTAVSRQPMVNPPAHAQQRAQRSPRQRKARQGDTPVEAIIDDDVDDLWPAE